MANTEVSKNNGAGLVFIHGTATLAAGTVTIASGLTKVLWANAIFTTVVAATVPISVAVTGGSCVFTSGGSSTDTLLYEIIGHV